jgi:MFS family permease
LGYVVGAAVAERFGWRSLFGTAAVPGVLLALGFYFVARDRPESISASSRSGFLASIKLVLASRILRLTILGYIFNTFALNGVALFVVRYGSSLGMEIGAVGKIFGLVLVCAGFVGTLGGGRLASWYARHRQGQLESLLFFVSVSTFVGVPFLGLAFLVETPELFFVACFLAEVALFAGVAPLNSVIVARAPHGLETFTQGVTIFSIQLFGSALAPIFIGKLADILSNDIFERSSTDGAALGYALQLSTVAMVISAVLWLLAALAERGERQTADSGKF